MQCTLLIPGLLWPRESAGAALHALDLPALRRLLARARSEPFPAIEPEGWLCQAFEVERRHDWPIAPLTLALDRGDPGEAYWLRADPVHIEVERDRLALVDSSNFALSAEEAQALAAALDEHFARERIAFRAPVPTRWYARVEETPAIVTRGIGEVAGRDVQRCLPTGEDALRWHRVFNEAQMLLHTHPVNAAREARGEPIVNSVWLWGGGRLPLVHGRPFEAVWSDDVAALALAAAAEAEAMPLPRDAQGWIAAVGAAASHLIVLDGLKSAMAYRDLEAWRERLAALEACWFQPLERMLRDGRVSDLALVLPAAAACHRFDLTRRDLYKFWRSGGDPAAYA